MLRTPIITLMIALLSLQCAFAQSEADEEVTGNLYLSGKILNEKRRGQESTIQIYRKRALVDEIKTNSIGKFEFKIPLQDSIVFAVLSEGYVSKTIWVDTDVPYTKRNSDFNFPFFIELYPIGRIPENIDLDRPVGQILFSGVQFVYDTQFTKRANKRLKEHVSERKSLKVREIKE